VRFLEGNGGSLCVAVLLAFGAHGPSDRRRICGELRMIRNRTIPSQPLLFRPLKVPIKHQSLL